MNKKLLVYSFVLGIAFFLSFLLFALVFGIIDFWLDYECYQLRPNESYRKSICERYWK